MAWNKETAIKYAQLNALPKSSRRCARFVCNAVTAGGVRVECSNAKDLGTGLIAAGFYPVHDGLQKGDIAIIQATAHHAWGHACIYDGHQWISDFRQREMYPGQEYRDMKPLYVIYRHN